MPTQIIADHRESLSPVVAALRGHTGVEVNLRHLSLGDYCIDGRLLFERKTLRDLAVSLRDGRLLAQAARMAAAPMRSAIILEGKAQDLAESGMRREALQGALVHIGLFYGLPILRAQDAAETARLIIYAARQLDQIVHHSPPPRLYHRKRPTAKRAAQLQMLQALPGIGADSAVKLLRHFGSVAAVCNANEQDLTEVDGIGNARAQRIRWTVSEAIAVYRRCG